MGHFGRAKAERVEQTCQRIAHRRPQVLPACLTLDPALPALSTYSKALKNNSGTPLNSALFAGGDPNGTAVRSTLALVGGVLHPWINRLFRRKRGRI